MPPTGLGDHSVCWQLTREPAEVRLGREQARKALCGWGLGEYADLAELIVSELVTNAICHGEGTVRVGITHAGGDLRVEVHDDGEGRPVRRQPAPDDEAGRGPLPGCPAISGRGTDLSAARFTLVADGRVREPDGQMTVTEVFGFWQVPGQDGDDLIHADGFEVPVRSPVAVLARKVARSRRRTRAAGRMLAARITACPCVPVTGCPAYDDVAMLEAIEHAARQWPGRWLVSGPPGVVPDRKPAARRETRPGGTEQQCTLSPVRHPALQLTAGTLPCPMGTSVTPTGARPA